MTNNRSTVTHVHLLEWSTHITAGMRILAVLAAGIFLFSFRTDADEHENSAETVYELDRPIVIAHRGYKAFAPENTMPSMELAVASGADLIELDVHYSSDEVPVVIHDRTLDRTTNSAEAWKSQELQVSSTAVAELSTLDAGEWFHERFEGTKIPQLGEVLSFIHSRGGITLIDRKAGSADQLVALLRQLNLTESVIVQAFDWTFLASMHALEPEIILSAAGPPRNWEGQPLSDEERALSAEWVDRIKKAGGRALAWNEQVTREAIDYAHENGIKVWIYTINDVEQAGRLLDLGADGVITDNPSVIWKGYYLNAIGQADLHTN